MIFIAADAANSHREELRLPGDCSVVDAPTVEAAAAISQRQPLDLVILGMGRPAARALAMLRQLKADPRLGTAPLVLFGAFEDMSAIRLGLELGARDYLIRGETTPWMVARRVPTWLDHPARRTPGARSSRPAPAGRAPAIPAPRIALASLFGGSLVGLGVLLLQEMRFPVVGHAGNRS